MSNKNQQRSEELARKKYQHYDSLVFKNTKAHKETGEPIDHELQKKFATAGHYYAQFPGGEDVSSDDMGKTGGSYYAKLQDDVMAGEGEGYTNYRRALLGGATQWKK